MSVWPRLPLMGFPVSPGCDGSGEDGGRLLLLAITTVTTYVGAETLAWLFESRGVLRARRHALAVRMESPECRRRRTDRGLRRA